MNRSELQIRIDELADDFLERRRDGEKPTIEEYANANPDIATPLRRFLKTILMVDGIKDETEFLNSGSIVGSNDGSNSDSFPQLDDYEIIREIGRGKYRPPRRFRGEYILTQPTTTRQSESVLMIGNELFPQ